MATVEELMAWNRAWTLEQAASRLYHPPVPSELALPHEPVTPWPASQVLQATTALSLR